MSLETWIGLARNGLCVVADTLPEHYDQFGRFESGMSTLNALIAPLQFAAAVFNFRSALKLPAALQARKDALALGDACARSRSSVAVDAHTRRVKQTTYGVCYAILSCTLAPAFLVLTLNSCKVATEHQVQWALLAMQLGLALALWAMREEYLNEFNRAVNCEEVADGERDKSLRAQACCDAGLIDQSLEACVFEEGEMGAIKTRCGALLKKAGDRINETGTKSKLLAHAVDGRRASTFAVVIWVLNVVAFWGYAVFPLTYFGPFTTIAEKAWYEWAGNLAGDAAWTVEPALVILSALGAFSSRKAKTD